MIPQKTSEDGASANGSSDLRILYELFAPTNKICEDMKKIKQEVWEELCLETLKIARTSENLDYEKAGCKALELGHEAKAHFAEKVKPFVSVSNDFPEHVKAWVSSEKKDFLGWKRQKVLRDILMGNLDEKGLNSAIPTGYFSRRKK